MEVKGNDSLFKSSCAISVALCVVTYCISVSLCTASGWMLVALSGITAFGILMILFMFVGVVPNKKDEDKDGGRCKEVESGSSV
jgi:hypothetical protein